MIKQSEAQSLGRRGERWFQSILPKEWLYQKPEEDIGIDGRVIIGNDTYTGGVEFNVQIKSSKQWMIQNNTIAVRGINRDTVKYWGTRLYPTMIVLYDESKNTGFYGWLFDILSNPIDILSSPNKTITLLLDSRTILDQNSWQSVKGRVENYYTSFLNSLATFTQSVNVMPTVHSLINALRLLHAPSMAQPKNSNEHYLLALGEVTAHRTVIDSLRNFSTKYGIEPGSPNRLQSFIDAYRAEVDKFISDFDIILNQQGNVVVRTKPLGERLSSPKMTLMIMDLIYALTGDTSSPRNENKES